MSIKPPLYGSLILKNIMFVFPKQKSLHNTFRLVKEKIEEEKMGMKEMKCLLHAVFIIFIPTCYIFRARSCTFRRWSST